MTKETNKNNDTVTMSTAFEHKSFGKLGGLIPSKKTRNALLILVIIFGGLVYVNTNKPSKIPPFNQATVLILKGGKYEDAIKILDRAIHSTSDKKKIAELNLQKASVSIATAHLDNALVFAKTAESTYPSTSSSSMIAEIASIQKNIPLAVQWYKTTISRLDKNAQSYQSTLQELQNYLKELGQ